MIKNNDLKYKSKKGVKNQKKGLREVCDDRKSPFTGDAVALLGWFLERKRRGPERFLRISRAGCAKADVRRVRLVLSSTLFDSMKTLKRYVGSLVHERWISLSYRATRGFAPIMWCQLHCLSALVVFGYPEHR